MIGMIPLLPGLFAFGMAFGTVAARKGFTLDRNRGDERHRLCRHGADDRARELAGAAHAPRHRRGVL